MTPSAYAAPARVARNAAYTVISEVWSALVLLVAIPALVSALGDSGFGLFSIAWILIAYLLFLDIGVSRGATKFVSEYLAASQEEAAKDTVRTGLISVLVLGGAGGTLIALVTPIMIRVLKIGPSLAADARVAFFALAICIPILLAQSLLRAVLSALHEFGWMSLINSAAMTFQWLVAWIVAKHGAGVGVVVVSTVLVRLAATVLFGIVLWCAPSKLLVGGRFRPPVVRRLLHFGSWVTVSQVVSPLLVYLDRVLLARFVSLAAVTFYSVPYEVMTRLRVIPSAVSSTLFPAFSERATESSSIRKLYSASLRYLLLLLTPVFAVLLSYGSQVLSVWMGAAFSREAGIVLQIMVFGGLMNCLAYVPYTALQAMGRPDLTGKFHLFELVIHTALCFTLIPHWGLIGAAVAGTSRYVVDALLLFGAISRVCSLRLFKELMFIRTLSLCASLIAGLAVSRIVVPGIQGVVIGVLLLVMYGVMGWWVALYPEDKLLISRVLRPRDVMHGPRMTQVGSV